MEKKRINLFTKKGNLNRLSLISSRLQLVLTLVGAFLFIVYISLTVLSFLSNREYARLQEEKKQLLQFLSTTKNTEVKVVYVGTKESQIQSFIKDDLEFLPYYEKVNALITAIGASDSAKLVDVALNSKDEATLVLEIINNGALLKVVSHLEDPIFLSNFDELKLNNLSVFEEAQSNDRSYKIELMGKLKKI